MARLMTKLDMPDPDLKARQRLTSAAPCSSNISSADPAFGYVMVTVLVLHAPSVTTVSPLGSVVTEADVALAFSGDRLGRLHNIWDEDEKS